MQDITDKRTVFVAVFYEIVYDLLIHTYVNYSISAQIVAEIVISDGEAPLVPAAHFLRNQVIHAHCKAPHPLFTAGQIE